MKYLQYVHSIIPGEKDKEVLPVIVEVLEPLFRHTYNGDEAGIYVASSNAGFISALRFWGDARLVGFGVANPELFPWTLANGPCSYIARQFKLKGPNATFIGDGESVLEAIRMYQDHMSLHMITHAWIVAIDFGCTDQAQTYLTAFYCSHRENEEGVFFDFSLATSNPPSIYLLHLLEKLQNEIL